MNKSTLVNLQWNSTNNEQIPCTEPIHQRKLTPEGQNNWKEKKEN